MDADLVGRAVVSLLVITAVLDPVKILFFNQAVATHPRGRRAAALQVAFYIIVILGGAALVGKQFLDLLGIDLNAFTAVGGFIIMSMGFEMLYGGEPSRAQGEKEREEGPEDSDTLLIPLSLPLIAGPGAITTTITIASQDSSWDGVWAALIAVAAVAVAAFMTFAWLGGLVAKAKEKTMTILTRIGGLLLATIGAQMMFNGLKNFFA